MGYVILGLVAGLAAVERKGFLQAMLSRPIVLGPLVGWALGDAAGGLLLAPALELLWLGAVNLGAAVPVHEALGTAAVVGGAVLAARQLGTAVTPEIATLAVLVAAPVAFLGRLGEREGEIWNQRFASRAEQELAVHHLAAAVRYNLYGLGVSFAVSAVLAPAAAAVAAWAIPALLRLEPGLARPLHVGFFALVALASAAAAKALRARGAALVPRGGRGHRRPGPGRRPGREGAVRATTAVPTVVPVPRRVLAQVFFRSLFLQATWNRRGMQNLGFAYAIEPALRALYPDPERHEEALRRHLGFFNCHPYMAAAILGGTIHHEERVAVGLEPADAPQGFKQTLQGPLAAIGDGFFWTALRPFFGALGAVGALTLGLPAVWAVLIVYNAIHVSLRVALFRAGYRSGDALVPVLAKLSLPVVADRLRTAGAALAGVTAGMVIFRAASAMGALGGLVAAAAAVLGYAALAHGSRLFATLYVTAAAGTGAAVLVAHLHGSP